MNTLTPSSPYFITTPSSLLTVNTPHLFTKTNITILLSINLHQRLAVRFTKTLKSKLPAKWIIPARKFRWYKELTAQSRCD